MSLISGYYCGQIGLEQMVQQAYDLKNDTNKEVGAVVCHP